MANYDDIVEQHKRSLTKAQIKALADASQKYSLLSAKSRAEAQTTSRGQYDSGYRALQNMGLAGASGAAPASGEVPRLRTNIESSLDQFNQSLANVEHQRLAQLGAAFAKQTRANRAAEAAAQQQQAAQDTLAKQMQRAQAVARATGMKTLASVPKLKAEDLVLPSVKEFPESKQDMYKASVQQRQGQIAERQAEIQRAQAVAAAIGMKTPASLPARKASDLTTPSVYEQPEKPAPKTAPQTEAASEKSKERAYGGKPAAQDPAFTMQSKTAMPYTQYEAKQQATKWASMITENEEKPKTVAAPDLTAEPKTETKPESYSSKKKTLEDLSALVKQYEAAEEKKQKYADTKDKEAYYDEMKSTAEKELTGLGYSVKTARQVVEQGIPGLEKREPKQEVATSAKDRLDALLRKRMEKDQVTDDELEKAQREADAEAAEEKRKKLSDPAYIKYFSAQKEYKAAVRQQEEGYKQAKEKSEAEQKNLDAVKEIYRKYEAAEARFFYGTDTPEENDLRASQMQSAIEELQSLGYTLDSAKQLIDTGVTEPKYEESPAVAEAREKLYWAKMEYDEPKTYAAAQIIYNWDQYSQYVSPEVRQEAAKIWSDHMAKEMGFKTPSMTDEEYSYNVDRFKATYEDLEPILRMYDHAHELSGDDAQALTKQADAAAKKLGFNGEQDIRSFQSRMNIEQDARMEYQYFQPALEALYLHAGEKPTKRVNEQEQDATYRRVNGLQVITGQFMADVTGFGNEGVEKYVTDQQRDAYNAIYEQDGIEAANKYIDALTPLLNLQRAQEDEKYYRQFADEHPSIGNIRSIGANLLYNIPAFAEQRITGFVNMFREDPIYYDVNSDISYRSSRGEYIRSERTQNILANQERPEWMNNFLASAYGTTMSILDSAAAMGVAMLGAPWFVDLLFASSAGNSAFKDAKARGATQDQAMDYAGLQALAEMLFEHISLERHIDQFVNARSWLAENFAAVLAASGASELSEEVATGIADAIIDVAVMGDKAEINQAAREYRANDETPNKAFWHAFSDQGKDILLEGISGFVSGSVFAAAGAGANAIRTKRAGSQLRSSLDMMSRYEDVAHILGGESMDALTKYEEKPTDTSAGKMKAVIDDAVLTLYKDKDAPSVYEDREAKSAKGEAEEKAAAVTALLNGDQMNESTAQTVLDVLGKKTVQDMGYDVSSSLKFAVSYNERVAQYGIKSRTAVLQETVQKIKDAIESVPEPVEPKKAAEAVWKDPNLGFTVTEDGKRIQSLPGNMTSVAYEEQQKNNFSARTTAKAGNVTYAISGMEVRDGLDNGQTLAEIKKNMSQEHLAKAQFLEKLSKGLPGVGLVIHDTMGPHINASFDAKTNAIHVSLDSPQSVLRVLSHELTHMIKRNAIGAFGELQQAIIDEIGQERFDSMARKKADDYTKMGDPIDYDTKEGRAKAEEETVAELCEQMLSRTDWLEQFCQEHTEAARTLKDYILKIVNAIQDALKDVNNQRYGQSASEAISAQRTFEKWAAALDTALENVGKNVEADIDAEADANAEIYADESTVRAQRRLEDLQREAESEMKKGPYPRGYSTKAVDSVIDQVIQVLGGRDSFSADDYERLRARIGQSLPVIEAWLTDMENEAKEQAALDRVAQVANEIVDAYRETEGSVDGLKELRVDIPDVIGIGPNQAGDIRSQLDKNGLFKLQAMISSALGKKVTLVTKSNAKYADALKMDELFSSMQEKYNLTDEQDFSRDALNLVDFIQGVRHTEEGTTTRMSDYGEEAREQAFLDVQTALVGALEEAAGQKAGVAYSLDTDAMKAGVKADIQAIRAIQNMGRVSINDFSQKDIAVAEPFAREWYKTMKEKSPFFRAWFGDWRAHDVKNSARIVSFKQGESRTINQQKRTVKNHDTQFLINVDDTIINDSLHYAKLNKDTKQISQLLSKIDEIIKNAVLLDTQTSEKSTHNKKGSTSFMHYLYTPVSINGAPFMAKLEVEEYDQSIKHRAYNLQRIELSGLSRAQFSGMLSMNRGKYAYKSDALTVAQVYDLVKQYDKSFKPGREVNPAFLNEDGTPKVFYHGTDAKFDAFDISQGRANMDIQGAFFAFDKESAKEYGKNVGSFYLSITNPAPGDVALEALNRFRRQNDAGVKAREYLISQGYDGVNSWGEEIIAFYPTQIKSATENIGTFDKSNPKFRYSLDTDYMRAAEKYKAGKATEAEKQQLQQAVDQAAKAAGYTIKAWHGSRAIFTEFSTEKRGANTGTKASEQWFFAGDYDTANSYYPVGVMKELMKQYPSMYSQKDIDSMERRGVAGKLYPLYLKMENPLVVDVAGYDYASHKQSKDAMMEFAEQANREGRDGIILLNARDNNLNPSAENSTVYMFRSSSQAKLADPVTYDDQGNIIPLSERFNTKNPDIRWSLDTDALRQNAHVFTQIDGEALKAGLEQLKNVTPGKGLWALQDISRFLDKIAGGDKKLRDTLTKIFETPHRQALKNYATGVGDMQNRVLDIGKRAGVCDEKGRHFDKKKSAAIQNIGEGFSNRRTNVTVRVVDADAVRVTATDKETGKAIGTKDYTFRELRGAYGREVADQLWSEAFDAAQKKGEHVDIEREVNTQPYTLADLKEAYPQDWQKLKAAADEFRTMYDEYIRNINSMLEVIYPYASKYATVDKLTEAIEKKQQRLADRKAAYNVQIENLQKSLEAKEQEIASKKKQDTKAYRQLIEQRNVLDTKIAEAKAEIEEYEQNVKDQLTVMGEEKALMQNAEREGDSLGRMHRLEYRSDYFHHFTEMTSGIQNLKSIFTGNTDISPAVVGKSDQTKPKSRFAGFFQQRHGGDYTADALNGMLRYGQLAEYKLAFDPLAAYLRDVEKQVVKLDKNATNRDNLIRYIQQWTNTILGKTHTLDRALVDSGIGMRSKLFKALNWINSRVIQNTLLWNMRSALIQISNVTNAKGIVTNNLDWANGLRKWALARRGNSEMQSIMNQSTFLASRYMDSLELTDSKLKSAKQFAGWLLGALDEVSAKATWWAAYTQYQRNPNAAVIRNASRSYDNAIDYADDVTRRTHAGRGVGELAPAMTSRVLNLVAPFQVEVNNTYQLLKDNVKQKNYLGLLSTGVSVFALNTIFEAIVGSTPLGFDFIRAIIDIAFGIAGDDPDDDDDDYSVGRAAQRLAGEFVGGLPYANQIVGLIGKDNAEKIIGSDTDVTRYGNTQIGLNALMNTVAGISDIGSAVKEGKNLFTETNFISDIDDLLNIIMPMGGKQLTRTAEGLITMAKGYGGKVDKTGTEKVQFIADNDLVNWLHAGLFGKWSLTEASEYFGEERLLPKLFGAYEGPKSSLGKPVDAREYKAALAAGIDGKEYFSLKLDLKEYTTQAGKRAEMMERGYTPEQKAKLDALLIPASSTEMKTSGAVVYQKNSKGEWEIKADYTDRSWFEISTLGSTQYEDAKGGVKAGLKPETYLTVYKKWKSIDSKDENGNTVNGLKKKRAQEYLDSLSVSPAVYEYIWTVIFGYKK